jgi:hypothetical protein
MAISFTCPQCGKVYQFKAELAGKKGKCGCGTVFSMPAALEMACLGKLGQHFRRG